VYRSKKDTSFCSATPLIITGRDTVPNVSNSYFWNTGSTAQTLNVTQPGTYVVTHTYSQGCFDVDTFAVLLKDPTLTIANHNIQMCAGDSIALSVTSNADTIAWNTGSTASSIMAHTAGQYWVRVSNTAGCNKTDTIVVALKPSPVVNLGNDTTICGNSTKLLDAFNAGASYVWNTGASSSSITASASGTYSVISTLNGCTAKDTIVLTVNPVPVVNLGNDTTICQNASVQLNALYTGATYLWNTGATSSSINVNATGQYIVTNNLNGCFAKDTINVTVQPVPVFDLGADTSICADKTLSLSAFYPAATYLWNTGATTSSIVVNTTGKYLVVSSNNNCSTKDSINVTVNPLPVVNLGNDTTICQGKTLQLNATYAGATYLWNTGSTASSVIANTSGQYIVTNKLNGCFAKDTINIVVQPAPVFDLGADTSICADKTLSLNAFYPAATYLWNTGATSSSINVSTTGKYLVVSTLNSCSAKDSINVTVTPLPLVDLGKDTSICANKTIQLNATYTGASYLWNTGATASTIIVNTPGLYYVVNKLNGCYGTDSINIAFQPAPLLDLGPDRSMCSYDTILLTAFYPAATYLWNTGATASSIIVRTAGQYSVTSKLNGCPASDTVDISLKKAAIANAGADLIIPQNSSVQLNATVHANNAQYLWSPAGSLNNATIPNPLASPLVATEYTLKVISTDGCIAEDKVMVNLQYPLIIPNAFSPNGDNINDKWIIGNIEFYPKCKVYIYNRYGQPVFLSDGYAKPWDGTNKGKTVDPATYYYIIETGDGRRSSGWVLLLK
jgi:gliding motility-associated-like protein